MIELDSHQTMILYDAIHRFGAGSQINKTIEELAELIKELCLFRSTNTRDQNRHQVEEELADVIIMIEQLLIMLNQDDEVTRQFRYKMNRLEMRLMEKRNE